MNGGRSDNVGRVTINIVGNSRRRAADEVASDDGAQEPACRTKTIIGKNEAQRPCGGRTGLNAPVHHWGGRAPKQRLGYGRIDIQIPNPDVRLNENRTNRTNHASPSIVKYGN